MRLLEHRRKSFARSTSTVLRFCLLSLTVAALASLAQSSNPSTGNTKDFRFEVLSIRPMQPDAQYATGNTNPSPNGFVTRLSAFQLIMLAYAPGDYTTWGTVKTRNMPNWDGAFYDINGRVAEADLKAWQHQSPQHELLRVAIRTALSERCKLAIHEELAKAEDFELVMGKNGPRLQSAAPGFTDLSSKLANAMKLRSEGVMGQEVVNGKQVKHFYGATMEDLAAFLIPLARGIPVYDRTRLTGRYDFILREQTDPLMTPGDPNYFLDKYPIGHLGLELKRGVEIRPMLVIDHIEKPAAN